MSHCMSFSVSLSLWRTKFFTIYLTLYFTICLTLCLTLCLSICLTICLTIRLTHYTSHYTSYSGSISMPHYMSQHMSHNISHNVCDLITLYRCQSLSVCLYHYLPLKIMLRKSISILKYIFNELAFLILMWKTQSEIGRVNGPLEIDWNFYQHERGTFIFALNETSPWNNIISGTQSFQAVFEYDDNCVLKPFSVLITNFTNLVNVSRLNLKHKNRI
jgi:hypothetical protein